MRWDDGRVPKLNPSTDVVGLSGLVIVNCFDKKRGDIINPSLVSDTF